MEQNLADIRKEYKQRTLDLADLDANPFVQFKTWLSEATKSGNPEPTAMHLSTVSQEGRPSGRMVLLKGLDAGFIFYTNLESRKGQELKHNPYACLTFFWPELERQVRIEGKTEIVESHIADEYYKSRPAGSRIGAYISPQSKAINSREELEQRYREFEKEWPYGPPTRPDFWGGIRLLPDRFEFWQGRPSRLHDRFEYLLMPDNSWKITRLAP